jgi:hypothetical protein
MTLKIVVFASPVPFIEAPIPLILAFPPPIELLYWTSPAKSLLYFNILNAICFAYMEGSLSSHAVRDEHLEQMICDFIKFLNLLDVSSHNSLFFLEHSDGSEHLHVHQLPIFISLQSVIHILVVEVLESDGDLMLTLLVEYDLCIASVIIHFKDSPHWFFNSLHNHAHEHNLYHNQILVLNISNIAYIIDCFSVYLADIVWSGLSICHHLQCHGDEYSVFGLSLVVILLPLTVVMVVVVVDKESSVVVVWKLNGWVEWEAEQKEYFTILLEQK